MEKKFFVATFYNKEQLSGVYTDNVLMTVIQISMKFFFSDFLGITTFIKKLELENTVYCLSLDSKETVQIVIGKVELLKGGNYQVIYSRFLYQLESIENYKIESLKTFGIQETLTFI